MTIPIRNLYYLFTYAWGRFPAGSSADAGIDECPDLPNLFARLLIDGANRLLRRGLDRGYLSFLEESRAPRGRMLLDHIVKRQSLRRGALVCAFDELSPDVAHNQIIKATALTLARARNVEPAYAHELALLAKRMAGVSDVRLTPEAFRRVQLSRNTGQYVPMLRLCELVFRSLMPEESGNATRFADILEDRVLMSAVFEDFLRTFYSYEQTEYAVAREVLSWAAVPLDAGSAGYVPTMETDITLRSPARVIVFDAKFYRQALVERDGIARIRSNHLYQLFSYLQHTERRYPGRLIDGGLIYPQFGRPAHLRYRFGKHHVLIWTIDLTRQWQHIHEELLSLPALITGSASSEMVAA